MKFFRKLMTVTLIAMAIVVLFLIGFHFSGPAIYVITNVMFVIGMGIAIAVGGFTL